jgi:hypothetical protein
MICRLKRQGAPKGISAVNMDIIGVRSSKPVNVLNQIYQLQKWQEIKDRMLVEVEKVEEALRGISQEQGCERYRDVLFMWYVEELDKEEIAERLRYSHRQLAYEIKNKAIKKFAIALFGVVALEAI